MKIIGNEDKLKYSDINTVFKNKNILTIEKVYDVDYNKLIKYVDIIREYDNNFDGCSNFKNLSFNNYKEWLKKTKMDEMEENLPKEYVPSFSYVACIGDEIIGSFNIRPIMNKKVEKYSGNIGYLINPNYRNRGFGTELLNLCIEECKRFNLNDVIVTCKESNIGSKKVIENNNGNFIEKVYSEDKKSFILRYKIRIDKYKDDLTLT